LPFIVNAFGHISSALYGDFRIILSFTFSCLPLATFPHIDFWDPMTHCVGWVGQAEVLLPLVHFLIFSFFFSC
jgi:hypothetical protein